MENTGHGELEFGPCLCVWHIEPHGLHLQVFLGTRGPGSILLGSSLLPKVTLSDAERYAQSYTTQLLTVVRDSCVQALMISTAPQVPKPVPAPAPEPAPQTTQNSDQSSVVRFGFDTKPQRYTSPSKFGFNTISQEKVEFQTSSWKEILPLLCGWLSHHCSDKMQEACVSIQFQGYKRRTLNLDGQDMQSPVQFEGGGYVETALGAKNVLALAAKILQFCGIDASTAWYEYELAA